MRRGFPPDTITLAAIPPAENSTDMRASYEPLIKLLEKKETGSTIEFVQASDYAGVVEGMIANNVDLAFFGPSPTSSQRSTGGPRSARWAP